jgi:hypothetical protein
MRVPKNKYKSRKKGFFHAYFIDAVTAQYVNVRLDRKKTVRKALHPQKKAAAAAMPTPAAKKPGRKKNSEMENRVSRKDRESP